MRNSIAVLTVLSVSAGYAATGDAKAGQAVYKEECSDCHSDNGVPSVKLQKKLNITMKDLRSPEIQALSDAELRKRSLEGIGKMKAVTGLSAQDRDNVIAYVRTLPTLKK